MVYAQDQEQEPLEAVAVALALGTFCRHVPGWGGAGRGGKRK